MCSISDITWKISLFQFLVFNASVDIANRPQWKEALRTLLVVVSECARLIPVQMQITGLLNAIVPTVPLAPLARYIQNWDKASKGMDMSREVAPNVRVGFRDPTIIKR